MNDMDLHSDELVLKDAVRRAWGQEVAPQSLRQSIGRLIAEEFHPVSFLARRSPFYSFAAAAVILLTVGLIGYQCQVLFSIPSGVAFAQPATTAVAVLMVEQHDNTRHVPREYQALNGNLDQVARRLKFLTGRTPLVRELPDGWRFRGAGVSEIAGFKASQLVFTRGRQSISLFSMPPVMASHEADPAGNYQCVYNKHSVAGFVTSEGLYCLVGYDPDGRLMPDSVLDLRNQIRDAHLGIESEENPTAPVAQ